MKIQQTLTEREKQYGVFADQAVISQDLKRIMQRTPKWGNLGRNQQEALQMIQHKISRILNGNPNNHDSWHDISGYATLVADTLTPAKSSSTETEPQQ